MSTLLARGLLDDRARCEFDDAELALGALQSVAHGGVEQTSDHLAASLAVRCSRAARCQSLLQSIPRRWCRRSTAPR